MDLNHGAAIFALAFVLVAPALSTGGETPQKLDLEKLEHNYTELEMHPGIDRGGLDAVRNTPDHNEVSDAGSRLGRVLFYDSRLSRNGRTSCSSCHLQKNAFADPRPKSRGFAGKSTHRNSMALANLAYYEGGKFFWDERGTTLEEMVLEPIQDKIEMGMNLSELVDRLEEEASYRWLFYRAYGDSEITPQRIAYALAQFLRSMVSLNSKFDEGLALGGRLDADFPNFSEEENLGKRLFMGLEHNDQGSSCASCHMRDTGRMFPARPESSDGTRIRRPRPVLFQGTVPMNNGIDSDSKRDDMGVAGVTGKDAERGKFKVPSLRNIGLTGPYMHDGRFKTLKDVIEHYSSGIFVHPTLDERLRPVNNGWGEGSGSGRIGRSSAIAAPQDQSTFPLTGTPSLRGFEKLPGVPLPQLPVTLPPRPDTPRPALSPSPSSPRSTPTPAPRARPVKRRVGFNFTPKERRALVAFLETLTDETFINDPKFADPFD
jgi:cytochrome c peroxidase